MSRGHWKVRPPRSIEATSASRIPEDRWTLGKCAFKIVQYLASGLPVIASPVGAPTQMIAENGFIAESTEQWISAIVRLAGDVQLRATMGAASRAMAERSYSVGGGCNVWAKTLGLDQSPAPSGKFPSVDRRGRPSSALEPVVHTGSSCRDDRQRASAPLPWPTPTSCGSSITIPSRF